MHELSLVFEIIRRVEEVAAENGVNEVAELTLEIGEASGVVPMFIEEVYAAACEGTVLEGSKLNIDFVTAKGLCTDCRRMFPYTKFDGKCPRCGKENLPVCEGDRFLIKEITVPETGA